MIGDVPMELDERRQELARKIETLKAMKAGRKMNYPGILKLAKNFASSMAEVTRGFIETGDILIEEEEFFCFDAID